MITIALLLIDAQVNMFAPDPVHDGPVVLSRLKELAGRARAAGIPVIFVRNNGSPDDPDAPHTPGSVSYTHLDVYKRQARHPAAIPVCREQARAREARADGVLGEAGEGGGLTDRRPLGEHRGGHRLVEGLGDLDLGLAQVREGLLRVTRVDIGQRPLGGGNGRCV